VKSKAPEAVDFGLPVGLISRTSDDEIIILFIERSQKIHAKRFLILAIRILRINILNSQVAGVFTFRLYIFCGTNENISLPYYFDLGF